MSPKRAHRRVGLSAVAFAVVTCGAASTAFAQQEAERPTAPARPSYEANTGAQLGARLGYAAGAGSVYSGLGVSDASNGAVPFIVDLGWRAIPELYAGVYGQFAPVIMRTDPRSCPDGFSCTAQNYRVGLELDYHFLPRTRLDPYVGFGGGYEILHTGVSGAATIPTPQGAVPGRVASSVVDRGWEFGNLTLGFDYRVSSALGLGPFATATLAKYNVRESDRTVTVAGNTVASAAPDVAHATHELFIVGLRGTFNP